jgi:murein DD-endopeptidase MepM/ murein hydrolase activator NlpD
MRSLDRGRTKLMTLEATRGKQPQFEHGYFWEWGVLGATHDDRVSYRLPYESGKRFRLFQGPGGTLSHQGEAAYDFPMPIGTPVRAARAGRVIEVVDAFGEGSSDPSADQMANEIKILHDDGTIGAYLHLLRGGMRVQVGDHVEAGTAIGLSGNSGRTTGPHLHFEVFRRSDGSKRRQTIPIRFRTADAETVVLEVGKFYRAD